MFEYLVAVQLHFKSTLFELISYVSGSRAKKKSSVSCGRERVVRITLSKRMEEKSCRIWSYHFNWSLLFLDTLKFTESQWYTTIKYSQFWDVYPTTSTQCTTILNLSPLCSVADPDPHGSKFILVGWIRIQESKKWPKKWKKFKFWSAGWYLLWQCCESGSVCFWASRIQIH